MDATVENKKEGRGGKRLGAGKPKGYKAPSTLNLEAAKQQLVQAYLDNIKPINDALIKKVKSGDLMALKELHDRVYGRAPQAIEMKGDITLKLDV